MRAPTWVAIVVSLGAPGVPLQGPIPVGLELRDGVLPDTPPAPPPMRAAPAPAASAPAAIARTAAPPAPAAPREDPVMRVVDDALDQQTAGHDGNELSALSYGGPPSPRELAVVDQIARNAGLDRSELASVTDRPRDQARFLVEKLFDPTVGEARVASLYGLPGSLAAESYRRLRNRFQVLDISPAQKETIVSVVETALVTAQALGQVRDDAYEWLDVDPGPRADRARFERAVEADSAVARCVRPSAQGDRFYLLVLPRDGAAAGGAVCRAPWTAQRPPGAVAETPPEAVADSGGSGAPARPAAPLSAPLRIAPPAD